MNWYNYLACFFSGVFLANAVPHYVQGLSGNKFPSPFANPPGKGLSSARVNTAWGLLNILVGYFLFRAGHVATGDPVILTVFFAGIAAISLQMSGHFANKDTE